MCVIYACGTSLPPEDELQRGSETNTDGAGLAWRKEGTTPRILWKKGFKDHEEVLAFIKAQKIPFPLAIHFRSASVGGVWKELCHPFPLGKGSPTWLEGEAEEVLFHNGHLSDWEKLVLAAGLPSKEKIPTGAWSDSRALAWLTYLKGEGILPFVVNGSRVLLFHATPSTAEDEVYEAADDHFSFYGTWINHPKEGWSQSINTIERMARRASYACYRGGTWTDGEWEMEPSPAAITSGPTRVEVSQAPNIWTVAELTKILADLESEQNHAKLAAGI